MGHMGAVQCAVQHQFAQTRLQNRSAVHDQTQRHLDARMHLANLALLLAEGFVTVLALTEQIDNPADERGLQPFFDHAGAQKGQSLFFG